MSAPITRRWMMRNASASPHHVRELWPGRSLRGRMRRRLGPLASAQLGRSCPRIGGEFGFIRRHRAFGQYPEARWGVLGLRQMPRPAAELAAFGEEVFDDAVFQRMERH